MERLSHECGGARSGFVLGLEEGGDLRNDTNLVLAVELEALRLVSNLHEGSDALFLGELDSIMSMSAQRGLHS